MNGDDAFLDERIAPDRLEELVFRNQPAGMADQRHQHVVLFRAQGDAALVPKQSTLGNVEDEAVEEVAFDRHHDDLSES